MRAVIQRVSSASVTVDGQTRGEISQGLLILLGITHGDSEKEIQWMVEKITNLRIFEGESGKLDLSVQDVGGALLIVSQFTLYGKCDKGRRPDFGEAAPIEEAKKIYEQAVKAFKSTNLSTEEGEFQANMLVELRNDGPLTLILDSPQS